MDEVLDLHAEMRRRAVCVRGLADSLVETPPELEATVGRLLEALVGRAVPASDMERVGRFSPDRPRPVVVRFAKVLDKVAVLGAKGALYGPSPPSTFEGVRIYHDLSGAQMDWKRRLRGVYEGFLAAGVRAVWRRGYRLMALLAGSWVEFYPTSLLI